jgi:hypothetical protein
MPRFIPNDGKPPIRPFPLRPAPADFAGGCEKLGGLGADNGQVLIFVGGRVLGRAELHHLAFRDHGGRRREDFERVQVGDFDHHLECLAEKKITHEHARFVAPQHPGSDLCRAACCFHRQRRRAAVSPCA